MYYLQLEYDNTIISIPFGKLKDIDNYTMQFSDRLVFLDRIIFILGLDIIFSLCKSYKLQFIFVHILKRSSDLPAESGFLPEPLQTS